jgi:tetratricopeptide (TPR) repeat protein
MEVSAVSNLESCNTWTEAAVHSPTVSTARLAVPGKASGEFQKGCGAFKGRRFEDAEVHLRKAIGVYPNYAAAWVVLGQVLDAQHKRDEARDACTRAKTVDPDYVPPYLCLADFAAADNNWEQVASLSGRALELEPLTNMYSLYYAANAAFHLKDLHEAETKANSAIKLDTWHRLPQLHLLLARVYEARGDSRAEIAQLKEYVKSAPNSQDLNDAKVTLAQLEAKSSR